MIFLVARLRRADPSEDDALREAYREHGAELYRFALRTLGDRGAAEDVVQETFVRAWRASERFDPAVASRRVWLFAIARNLTVDALRARAVRPGMAKSDAPDVTPDPAATDSFENVLSTWVVEEALGRIGEDHRHAIVEVHLRGRTPAEVAEDLGIPAATVRTRLFYGLKALRGAMDDLEVTR